MKHIQILIAIIALCLSATIADDSPPAGGNLVTDKTCSASDAGNDFCEDYCNALGDQWDDGFCNTSGKLRCCQLYYSLEQKKTYEVVSGFCECVPND